MANDLDQMCRRKSTRFLNICLKPTEQIFLVFLLPTLINCFVYLIHFSADLVTAIQHTRENNPIWGCCTIGFMYAPAIIYFVLTVSRPDWWMSDDDKATKSIPLWFLCQLCQLVFFPFFVLYRYAALLVLIIDAFSLSGKERKNTLNMAAAPAAIELYLFLQAWFQAAPQAVFQTHLLFRTNSVIRTPQTMVVQGLSILMSIVVLAIQTTSFQRFESQRINGRKLPWAMWLKKYCVEELRNIGEGTPLQSFSSADRNTAITNTTSSTDHNQIDPMSNLDNQDVQTERIALDRQISVTPPLPPKNARMIPPPAPLRGITTVALLQIPDTPAPPRPDSIAFSSGGQETLNLPGQSISIIESDQTLLKDKQDLKLPRRKPTAKGLEQDDPVGKFVSFLWWFFFIFARVLAITAAFEFYPIYLLSVLSVHYIFVLVFLFYYTKYNDVITFFFNLWLGLIYIFCIIEYRIKFAYANRWLVLFYTCVILENVFLTLGWYIFFNYSGFWYSFTCYTIFISMIVGIFSMAVYQTLFKPKTHRIILD
ncbi:uncharacterized protein [Prorops nasuta]|uniref:uncharacterized protein isoform X1 n=1 Tax=Prorops nasuta TaxID=863751 RepID=UPI0034D00C6D